MATSYAVVAFGSKAYYILLEKHTKAIRIANYYSGLSFSCCKKQRQSLELASPNMSNPSSEWMTKEDVARMLGIKPESAKVWMWRMGVKRAKGNSRFTHRSWVEQAMKNGKKNFKPRTESVLPRSVDSEND